MDKDSIQILLQIIQIITLPITLAITFSSFKKVIQSHAISEELNKAKYTNDFVFNFKKIISDFDVILFDVILFIKGSYYDEVNLSALQEDINNQEELEFDEIYYLDLLKRNKLDRKKVEELISPTGKLKNNFNETVGFCCEVNVFEDDFWYAEYYAKYLSLLDDLKEDVKISGKDKAEKISTIDTLLTHTLCIKEGNLLNDLECLCLNTKLGLINYDVIYNLIVLPFESIVKNYYIELMESILTHGERGYAVFSNIIDVYNELIAIKIKKIKNMQQKQEELKQMNGDKQDIFAK